MHVFFNTNHMEFVKKKKEKKSMNKSYVFSGEVYYDRLSHYSYL